MAEDGTTQNCTGDDTCLRHFEYKISIGRCHKCVLLANAPEIEHARIIGLPQCLGCGAASSRLDSDRCGQCVNKDMRNSGSPALSGPSDVRVLPQGQSAGQITSSTLRNLGQYNRNNWKDAANINESGIRAQQSTVPITGINMAALRSNNLPSTECYIFILEPFINSKGCTFLSTFEVIREASLKFSDVVANGITSFNLSWEQESEASLVRSDIHFSRMNNVHIEIGPQAIFRDVLQTILKDSGQSLDKTAPTKFRNRKLPIVYIEAHINLEKFLERTGVSPPRAVFKQKKRPWDGNTSITANVSLLKRSRLAVGTRSLKSSFTLNAPMSNAATVTLFFADKTANPDTGVQTITWDKESANSYLALIENDPCAKGRSKVVFKAVLGGLPYVAKRCYKIGRGQVSITENRDELIKEGITLGRTKFFLENFQSTCEEEDIDISEFDVTDSILAREGIIGESNEGSEKARFIPSPASGITDSAYSELSDGEKDEFFVINNVISSITWLLEPERGNVQFRKYSGTLEHPRHSDKQGATINAFQHFVYINSNKSLVLADIQASESHDSASKASVLFDLMSHTITGNSGGGDHGEDGIKTFVDQHECGQRCAQMGLETLTEPKEDE